jgi:hypothetical protein
MGASRYVPTDCFLFTIDLELSIGNQQQALMPNDFNPDDDKMRELILLIAQASEGDAPFGATKLNKLLFYIDFQAFVDLGAPITGHEYQRLPNGPAPKQLIPISKRMQANKECAIAERKYFGRTIKRTVALRGPNLEKFTASEVDIAYKTIKRFWGVDAKGVSDHSHRFFGWGLAADNETIPYEAALVNRGKRSRAAESIAHSLVAKAKECLSRAAPNAG